MPIDYCERYVSKAGLEKRRFLQKVFLGFYVLKVFFMFSLEF